MISKKKMCYFVKTVSITWGKNSLSSERRETQILERKGEPACQDEHRKRCNGGVEITGAGAQELGLNSGSVFD